MFVIAVITLPLLWWFARERGRRVTERLGRRPALTLLACGIPALAIAGFFPNPGGHDMASYTVYFTLGYLMVQEQRLAEWTTLRRWWLLALGFALLTPAAVFPEEYDAGLSPLAVGVTAAYVTAGLLLVLAVIGLGRLHLDRPYRWLPYANEASYPFYIWHQTVIVVAGFYIVQLPLGVWPKWVLVMAAGLLGSLAAYELLVRRWRPMRFLFGMRPIPRSQRASRPAAAATPTGSPGR